MREVVELLVHLADGLPSFEMRLDGSKVLIQGQRIGASDRTFRTSKLCTSVNMNVCIMVGFTYLTTEVRLALGS